MWSGRTSLAPAQRGPGRTRQRQYSHGPLMNWAMPAQRGPGPNLATPGVRRAEARAGLFAQRGPGLNPATAPRWGVVKQRPEPRATRAVANLGNAAEQVVLGLDGRQRATRAGRNPGNATSGSGPVITTVWTRNEGRGRTPATPCARLSHWPPDQAARRGAGSSSATSSTFSQAVFAGTVVQRGPGPNPGNAIWSSCGR